MHRVCLCELVPSTSAVRLEAKGRPVPLKTWRPMIRAALTQISIVMLIASIAFIKVGQQIINQALSPCLSQLVARASYMLA